MAANKIIRFGPVELTTVTTTNIINPPTLTGGVGLAGTNANTYLIIRHVRIVNKTSLAANCAFWLGITGGNTAGTEVLFGGGASAGVLVAGTGVIVPANSFVEVYPLLRMNATEFLVGGAGTALALTFEAEGEIGIA